MKEIKVKDIIKVCDGNLICGNEEYICKNFSKDTRTIQKGDVFVGIKGENFDGNILYKEAIKKGAKVCILQKAEIDKDFIKNKDVSVILVQDTIIAIGKIANYKRNLYGKNFPVVAITGSVGKTSTKDIIASVLSEKYKVLKTEGNLNNHIGLPFTILKLKEHTALVVEMGMNHFGEIEYLTEIAEPNIAVITNIGTSHIGNLGSRENILKAKLEITKSKNVKHLVINNDNDLLHEYYNNIMSNVVGVDVPKGITDLYSHIRSNNSEMLGNPLKIHTFGIKNNSQVMAKNIELKENSSEFDCKKAHIHVPIGGQHFVYNAICAFTVGKILNIEEQKIKEGIERFELTKKRMEIIKMDNDITVINDSYNASYDSMKAAIQYLNSMKKSRKIAALGDMLELGEFSKNLHCKVGEEIAKNKIDILITVGENAQYINKTARELDNNIQDNHFTNTLQAAQYLKSVMKPGDVILLKASNGMKFSDILDYINN